MTLYKLVVVIFASLCKGWDESDFDHSVYLDSNDKFHLLWNIISDTKVEFGLAVESVGWVAIGISPNGGMAGSDIVMGWVDETDTVYLQNRYAVENSEPLLMDDQSNVVLLEGSEVDGSTFLRFQRLIYPCDEYSMDIVSGTARVIFAWNDADPVNDDAEYHGSNRGTKSVNILQTESKEAEMPADVLTYDVIVDNYTIPNTDTTYYCKLLELPETDDIHHIIRISPVITPGNEGVVHHILLYYCPENYFNESDIGYDEVCNQWANMGGSDAVLCLRGEIVAGWAIGGSDYYFPSHVGIEMGGTSDDGLRHVLMQMHYDNPDEVSGMNDSSGVRLWYTPTLRNNSASMIMIGTGSWYNGMFIPPGMDNAVVNGYCTEECTSQKIPEGGVFAFANMLHTHLLGTALRLRHIRNETELPYLAFNEAYDFDYQEFIPFTEEVQILPGDTFMLECTYDSSNRSYVTFGGLSTYEEMCLSFLYVYPKVNISSCTTNLDYDAYLKEWLITAANNSWSPSFNDDQYGWYSTFEYNATTAEAEEHYNSLWANNDRKYLCSTRNTKTYATSSVTVPIPSTDFEEYIEQNLSDCSSAIADSSSSSLEIWTQWYFYLAIALVIFFIALCLLYVYCWRKRKKEIAVTFGKVQFTPTVE